MIMIAFYGWIRRGEHHALFFEDVTIDDDKKEVFIRLKVTKGNKAGRTFAITDDDIVEIIKAYRENVISKSVTNKADG